MKDLQHRFRNSDEYYHDPEKCQHAGPKSIDQGPFELGTTRHTLGTTPEGDVRATNIVLQGLPKDIYKLINHNIKAKAFWDNVKMLLAGFELTKEDIKSQLYDEFKRFKMLPGWKDRGSKCSRATESESEAQENGVVLNEEELLFLAGEQANTFDADVDSQPVQDLALNEDNIFQADGCDTFDSDVDDEPTAQSIFMANLSSVEPANLQASPSIASILSEANVIDSTSVDMGNGNVIPYEQYLSVDNISVVPSCASFVLNGACVLSDNDVFVPYDPIATELKIYKEQVTIYEQRAKFELTEHEQRMDDQMRAQNPFYLRQTKKAQPAIYDGEELLKTHHVPVIVPSSDEDLVLAEATRNKMHAKMNDSTCVEKRAEELKENAPPLPVLPPATVYPPNTPVHLVPLTLPTTRQVNIGLYVITQLFWDFEKTCKKRITPMSITEGERGFEQTKRCYLTKVIPFFNLLKEYFNGVQKSLVTEVRAMKAIFENLEVEVDQNEIDLKSSEIKQKNLLIANENLIVECLSKDVFYTATDSVLNVTRFF
ncbi:hypothetical protein Tco_1077114, partial [Tanacetum coccineum]